MPRSSVSIRRPSIEFRPATTRRDATNPYDILGLAPGASAAEAKAAYHKLVREYHPDKLMAQGMPQEFIDVANAKLATINEAYARIRRGRGAG